VRWSLVRRESLRRVLSPVRFDCSSER